MVFATPYSTKSPCDRRMRRYLSRVDLRSVGCRVEEKPHLGIHFCPRVADFAEMTALGWLSKVMRIVLANKFGLWFENPGLPVFGALLSCWVDLQSANSNRLVVYIFFEMNSNPSRIRVLSYEKLN